MPDNDSSTVVVSRRMLFAFFAVAFFSLYSVAGLVSGLAHRAGADVGLTNAIASGLAGIATYPYFAIRAQMKFPGQKSIAPFWKWAFHWASASLIVHFAVYRLLLPAL